MSDTNQPDAGPGYEVSDARVGTLMRFGVMLVTATALSFLGMWLLAGVFSRQAARREPEPPPMMPTGVQLPPEPRLQVRPNDEVAKIREEEESQLDGYGWVDKAGGVVRIPIERAIELLAERGLPAREAGGEKR